jgi:hypothetical protein
LLHHTIDRRDIRRGGLLLTTTRSKIENVCKGIIRLIAVRTELKKHLPEDVYFQLEQEIGTLEQTLYGKGREHDGGGGAKGHNHAELLSYQEVLIWL